MNKDRLYKAALLLAIAAYTVHAGGSMPATLLGIGLLVSDMYSRYLAYKEVKNLDAKIEASLAHLKAEFAHSVSVLEIDQKTKISALETKMAGFGMLGAIKRSS